MNAGARDTVNIDESVHEIYKQLTEGNDPVNSPFKTMKDVFLWAACLGLQKGDRKPISGKRIIIFRWAQFSTQIDLPIIKALSLSCGESFDLSLTQDQILNVIEEYANSGIVDLRDMTIEAFGEGLYGLVETIISKNN